MKSKQSLKTMRMSENHKLRRRIPFLSFIGCSFLGIALGLIWRNITAGTLIGLGAGLIIMVLMRFILQSKKDDHPNSGSAKPKE